MEAWRMIKSHYLKEAKSFGDRPVPSPDCVNDGISKAGW